MNKWVTLAVFCCFLTSSSCGNSSAGSPAPNSDLAALAGKEWILQSFHKGDEDRQVLPDTEITLSYSDGRLGGSGGCNRYFTSLELAGDLSLKLGPIGSTMMACPEPVMDQEAAFLNALEAMVRFEVESARLMIYFDEDGRLEFTLRD